jgi:hypothetical protein
MASLEELHARLQEISIKLEETRSKMEFKRGLNDGHNLTSGELIARYAFLQDALDKEVSELETHDHHVSALEQDAITWINSVDLGSS